MRDLSTLAKYLPTFSDPSFRAGEVLDGGRGVFPHYTRSEVVSEFVDELRTDGWLLKGFNWLEWTYTPRGIELLRDVDAIGGASVEELAMLLTMTLRQDHFSAGSLLSAFESGNILAIVRRAEHLKSEQK